MSIDEKIPACLVVMALPVVDHPPCTCAYCTSTLTTWVGGKRLHLPAGTDLIRFARAPTRLPYLYLSAATELSKDKLWTTFYSLSAGVLHSPRRYKVCPERRTVLDLAGCYSMFTEYDESPSSWSRRASWPCGKQQRPVVDEGRLITYNGTASARRDHRARS